MNTDDLKEKLQKLINQNEGLVYNENKIEGGDLYWRDGRWNFEDNKENQEWKILDLNEMDAGELHSEINEIKSHTGEK